MFWDRYENIASQQVIMFAESLDAFQSVNSIKSLVF